MKLIFWGCPEYDSNLFEPIKNIGWCKPRGGLWTSPIDSSFGWIDWCKAENFREEHFKPGNFFVIDLKENAKIYKIDTLEDLVSLQRKYPDLSRKHLNFSLFKESCTELLHELDFEKISKEYDAIFLTEDGQWKTRVSYPNLYGWDCECVLVLNKEVIEIDTLSKVNINLKEFSLNNFDISVI